MGGEVGKALGNAGGKQLRDAVAQAAKNATLATAGDGIILLFS